MSLITETAIFFKKSRYRALIKMPCTDLSYFQYLIESKKSPVLTESSKSPVSIAYYLFPDWCEPEYATCVVPNLPSEVEIKWDFSELTDTAQTGDATKGTAEKGKKMNDVIVEHVVKTLKELDATDWKYKPVK